MLGFKKIEKTKGHPIGWKNVDITGIHGCHLKCAFFGNFVNSTRQPIYIVLQ